MPPLRRDGYRVVELSLVNRKKIVHGVRGGKLNFILGVYIPSGNAAETLTEIPNRFTKATLLLSLSFIKLKFIAKTAV